MKVQLTGARVIQVGQALAVNMQTVPEPLIATTMVLVMINMTHQFASK